MCNVTAKCLPSQIHWPVSERRRMECLVSGKDANVSTTADSERSLGRAVYRKVIRSDSVPGSERMDVRQ